MTGNNSKGGERQLAFQAVANSTLRDLVLPSPEVCSAALRSSDPVGDIYGRWEGLLWGAVPGPGFLSQGLLAVILQALRRFLPQEPGRPAWLVSSLLLLKWESFEPSPWPVCCVLQ